MPSSTAPASRRREQQRAEARRAILGATEELLLEAGFDAFSMRRLVERSGYSAPTIYHYFGDKKGLIDELLEEHFAELVILLREVESSREPVETLRGLFEAFALFGLGNPTHYTLLMTPREAGSAPLPSAEEAQAIFSVPLGQLEREERLGGVDSETVRQSFWALLHGLISLQGSRPDHPWSPGLLGVALEAMIQGFVKPTQQKGQEHAGGANEELR